MRTGREEYKAMTKFWGRIFLINFVVGVVTGITLEFQFGTNWSRYSRYVGDVFGPLLAIEATVAFFLESTFIAVWALGWERLSPRLHALTIWLVAGASNISAVWILMANAWMQHPVGYTMKAGRPVLSDFAAVVTNSYAYLTIFHTLCAAYVVTGFFVMGVSAYHLLRKQFQETFTLVVPHGPSRWRSSSAFCFVDRGPFPTGCTCSHVQPAKLAALESHWVTRSNAPVYLLRCLMQTRKTTGVAIGALPGALSLLAYHSTAATVTGLRDIPRQDRPPGNGRLRGLPHNDGARRPHAPSLDRGLAAA